MNPPLGIALELINKRLAFAARLPASVRARVFPAIYGKTPFQPVAKPADNTSTRYTKRAEPAAVSPVRALPVRERVRAAEREINLVLTICAAHWNVPASMLWDAVRVKIYVRPRHAAMAILKEVLSLSTPTIGYALNRDHTTVMHGLIRHDVNYETDRDYAARFDAALAEVRAALATTTARAA